MVRACRIKNKIKTKVACICKRNRNRLFCNAEIKVRPQIMSVVLTVVEGCALTLTAAGAGGNCGVRVERVGGGDQGDVTKEQEGGATAGAV
jgi:hypothetical protein